MNSGKLEEGDLNTKSSLLQFFREEHVCFEAKHLSSVQFLILPMEIRKQEDQVYLRQRATEWFGEFIKYLLQRFENNKLFMP